MVCCQANERDGGSNAVDDANSKRNAMTECWKRDAETRWGDTDELLMCVKWMERDPNNEHTQPHTESGSWCIAHFVVIFNHIIQRYVFIVLFLLLADLMEILFIVCSSLLSSFVWSPMMNAMILLLLFAAAAAAHNARASTAIFAAEL